MKALNLSKRDQRVLLVGCCAILVIVGAGKGVPTLQAERAALERRVMSAKDELDRARNLLKTANQVGDSLVAYRRAAASLDSMLIVASSAAEAAASLSGIVSEAADSSLVRITATQLRPDSVVNDGFVHVAVRVSATSDIHGLASMFSALEAGGWMIDIREFTILQSDVAANPMKPEQLRTEIVVEALARVDTAARAAADVSGPTPATRGQR